MQTLSCICHSVARVRHRLCQHPHKELQAGVLWDVLQAACITLMPCRTLRTVEPAWRLAFRSAFQVLCLCCVETSRGKSPASKGQAACRDDCQVLSSLMQSVHVFCG
jgi:hypothetical protein